MFACAHHDVSAGQVAFRRSQVVPVWGTPHAPNVCTRVHSRGSYLVQDIQDLTRDLSCQLPPGTGERGQLPQAHPAWAHRPLVTLPEDLLMDNDCAQAGPRRVRRRASTARPAGTSLVVALGLRKVAVGQLHEQIEVLLQPVLALL